ncbi:hypothetical protein COO60DRAFT_947623 [Scenedesmus sp. NREL 46B-D3]|nr:hypothetical protein COO60DRAFT_947623 [Scenedesmus sp. NREL 46B-D3]
MQWTGDDGTASFFLVPNSQEFVANMSVGDTQLSSSPISFSADPSQPSNRRLAQQPQQQLLTAAPELLCTGEVESVRGESGQFPANLTAQQSRDKPAIYHPRGFFCRWELLPDYPELTVTVDYSQLLPDESVTLYLAPSNVIQLRRPKEPEVGGVFQTTVWVERSIFVEFQTTRNSTSQVGAFSVSWASSSPHGRSLMDSRTMVVVLACVSATGAVLAAFCFYCMCCSRRRRGAVVVDASAAQQASLLRVPSAVRELLPSKPYQPPPPDNPLPGAATEPDCCSICLVELEAGEHVTVLPCMHFYHKECIDSWLNRNCTCPLCKANVIHGFANTAAGSNNTTQQVQRSTRRHRHGRAGSAAAAGDGDAAGEAGSGDHHHADMDASANAAAAGGAAGLAAAAEIEMVHAPAGAAAINATEQYAGQLRAAYPAVYIGSAEGSSWKQSDSSGSNNSESEANGRSSRAPLSPAASPGTLQSGTVQASSADFAAAAAAAAAAIAAAAAGAEEEQPDATAGSNAAAAAAAARSGATTPPGAVAGSFGSTMSAAQASVSALRSSSWVWGRRLQGLLRAPSVGAPDAPAAAADTDSAASSGAGHHTVELRPAAVVGSRQPMGDAHSRNSSRASARSPELVLATAPVAPGRVAVSIYAYAGNPQPLGGGAEEQAQTGPELEGIVVEPAIYLQQQQQQQQQDLVRQEGSLGFGWFAGQAGSSSAAAVHAVLAAAGSSSIGVHSQEQDAAGDEEAGTPACRSFSLPGAIA